MKITCTICEQSLSIEFCSKKNNNWICCDCEEYLDCEEQYQDYLEKESTRENINE